MPSVIRAACSAGSSRHRTPLFRPALHAFQPKTMRGVMTGPVGMLSSDGGYSSIPVTVQVGPPNKN